MYGLDTVFGICDIDLGYMTLGQGHDTPSIHRQLFDILFTSSMAVRSYGSNTDFSYVCIVTLA